MPLLPPKALTNSRAVTQQRSSFIEVYLRTGMMECDRPELGREAKAVLENFLDLDSAMDPLHGM